MTRFKAKMEERARREEDLFIRAPLSKEEKRKEKQLKKSRNGYASSSRPKWAFYGLLSPHHHPIYCAVKFPNIFILMLHKFVYFTVLNLCVSGYLV